MLNFVPKRPFVEDFDSLLHFEETAAGIYSKLVEAYGEHVLLQDTCECSFILIKTGDFDMKDKAISQGNQ